MRLLVWNNDNFKTPIHYIIPSHLQARVTNLINMAFNSSQLVASLLFSHIHLVTCEHNDIIKSIINISLI